MIAYMAHTVNLARHEFVQKKKSHAAIAESLNSADLSLRKGQSWKFKDFPRFVAT
jgi:hypothetical protein